MTENFYKQISHEFSRTRQTPWSSWSEILKFIKNDKPLKILDIACGNGRFLKFLNDNAFKISEYTGIDSNQAFINECKTQYGIDLKAQFYEKDVLYPVSGSPYFDKTADLIVAFGFTHHIPGNNGERLKWFENLIMMAPPEGYIVLSFWNFLLSDAQAQKADDENSYYLGWDNRTDIKRYCHYYSDEEIAGIVELFGHNGLMLVKDLQPAINTTNVNDKNNRYLIFQKS